MAEPSVGDLLECAIWLDGTETEQQVKDWKERDCISALTQMAAGSMVIIGPVDYEIKYPGEDRVPPVPDHVSGPDVRLLVAIGKVVGVKPILAHAPSFIDELDHKDLMMLRRATRRAHAATNPGAPRLTQEQCDAFIAQIGPTAAGNAIRAAADGCLIH